MVLRCLIVDDSASFLEAARLLLELEGIEVIGTATTPAEALVKAVSGQPDVVLVDVMLGSQSGFDLARRLHEHRISVVMISTHAAADLEELLVKSRTRGFLSKSQLSASALLEIVGWPSA